MVVLPSYLNDLQQSQGHSVVWSKIRSSIAYTVLCKALLQVKISCKPSERSQEEFLLVSVGKYYLLRNTMNVKACAHACYKNSQFAIYIIIDVHLIIIILAVLVNYCNVNQLSVN